ncbi:MAG: penicillin-binding protein 1C [Paludibacteraceae bacterium]|nr:penicillin-binding protein 1C [Paludibacteraceae bacterium]
MWLATPAPLFDSPCATVAVAADGQLLGARISADGQWRFPPLAQAPERIAAAQVLYEDKRFRWHVGIDLLSLGRAVWQNLRAGCIVSGGSTLTMQLARISYGNCPRSLWQKIREANRALFLEIRYSKDQILAMYVSQAPYGGNVVGVSSAAWRYWGRPAEQLSWAEAATLAVLPNAPSLIHPGRSRNLLKTKRDALLKRLCESGRIDETDYSLALQEPLPQAPRPLPSQAPHLVDRIAQNARGMLVQTTLQADLQQRCQEIADRFAAQYKNNQVHNIAVLVAEVETGRVLAYVGNTLLPADPRCGNQVDVVAARRSSGSTLKPFLYAAMLQEGDLLPGTLVADIPININGFSPENYNHAYSGAVPASLAIKQSLNVPLVRMLRQYHQGRFLELLRATGFSTLDREEGHYGASLILGGGEISLWDLVGAYASLARVLNHYTRYNGAYNPADIHPLAYAEPGEASAEAPKLQEKGLYSAAAVYQMFEAMSALSRPEEEADWQQFSSMRQVAWKTGTSFGARDAWSVGVTPRHVVGVWVGNADGEGRAGLTGVGYAAPVMFSVFSGLPDGPWFERPYDEMVEMPVCRLSGHPAGEFCSPVDTLWVHGAGMELRPCPYHRRVHLSPDGAWQVNTSCVDPDSMVHVNWFVLPPGMAWYYRKKHLEYHALPPYRSDCEHDESAALQIVYPEPGAVLVRTVGMQGSLGSLVFQAAHVDEGAQVYWHLDEEFLGTTTGDHRLRLEPGLGPHRLTVVDDKGRSASVPFTVR